ncbi:MAG: ribbon-helix-helix protein, CopG family [Erysipelotrichaceae bacterium]|nr:ribbon-helix-helix protein, CopG family [Erysipelotrichaceae bacterium]
MSTNINIRVEEELKKALQGYAKLENKTVSEVVLEAIKEKLENDYDYRLALLAYNSVDMNDKTTLADMCAEAGIDYEAL